MDGTKVRVSSRCYEGVGETPTRFKTADFLNCLSVLAITCGMLSRLVQVAVAPSDSVSIFGEKLKLLITIWPLLVLAEADSLLSVPPAQLVVRSARVANRAMTRVPVLSFLGNGETTKRHLAVGF